MANSEADICNQALVLVGQTNFISSLSSSSQAAQLCAVIYPQARDALLSEFPWPFAKKEAALGLLSGVTRSGWGFAYQVPTDCLAPRYVFNGIRPGGAPSAGSAVQAFIAQANGTQKPTFGFSPEVPFEIQANDNGDGTILLCDYTSPTLVYTRKLTAPVAFTSLFVDALALDVAAKLAASLLKKPALADALDKRARMRRLEAGAQALRQQQEDKEPDADAISVRG